MRRKEHKRKVAQRNYVKSMEMKPMVQEHIGDPNKPGSSHVINMHKKQKGKGTLPLVVDSKFQLTSKFYI